MYKEALMTHPNLPPAVRLGVGLCFYRLGHLDRAKQCFERVLELEPTNVEV